MRSLLARLEQEARTAASLNHPNIVAVFDVGTHDGAPYVVSELLDGETLRDRLAKGPLPLRKAIDYVAELAEGLSAAHARGVVHRDLKPENIFLTTEGRAKILDFGLAKAGPDAPLGVSEAATMVQTLPGVVLGTVGYMSPEQVAGGPVDHRTDLFSLGAVLDEMVTGRRTFRRQTAAQTMTSILEDEPPPASSINPAVPATLDRIIHRCLEKSPAARFQSASDLAFALSTIAGSGTHTAPPPRSSSARFRYGQTAAVAALAASLGAVIAWVRGESSTGATAGGAEAFHDRHAIAAGQRIDNASGDVAGRNETGCFARQLSGRATLSPLARSDRPATDSGHARRVQSVLLARRRMDWVLHDDVSQEGAGVGRPRRHDEPGKQPHSRQRRVGVRRHDLLHAVFAVQQRGRRRQRSPQRSVCGRCPHARDHSGER